MAALVPGDVVVLRPGARVPVDGTIAEGSGALDESTITGESMPVHKGPGAPVFEATVNLDGVLDVTVTRGTAESTVARMIALVTEAQAAKAPSERFSAWFGQRYTVAVLLGAILAFGVFMALGWGYDVALYRAATLLVAASPCAVVISVPAAILSALSAAARGCPVQGRRGAGDPGRGPGLRLRQDRHAHHRQGRGDGDLDARRGRGRVPERAGGA